MNFFDKRPLSLILCISLGAFVFFSFAESTGKLSLIACAIALILISVFASDSFLKRRKLIFSSVLIIITCILSYLYFDVWFYADKRYEDRCEITGVVEEINFDTNVKTLVLKTDNINNDPFSSYKLNVILNDDDITNISLSTRITFTAKLSGFRNTSDFDQTTYYYARGYNARAESVEDIRICGQEKTSLRYKVTEYRKSLARKLVLNSNEESGGLLAALLLGERTFLNGQIKLDFSRIGITHILALSGMHLAILCYGISRLLAMIGINKKLRKISEISFAFIYMSLTGFPVSVVRAGVMLIISSTLFLLSSSKDSVTNLFLAVALIVLFEPFSVFDISLWLSAFATFGIIVCVEIFEKDKELRKHSLKSTLFSVLYSFVSGIFAITATMLLTHLKFGTISLLSIFSTVVFSPIILAFMYLGVFFLLCATLIPLSEFVKAFGGIICSLAHKLSSYRYALLTTNFLITKFLIIVTVVLFFSLIILKINRKTAATLLTVALLISSFISAGLYSFYKNQKSEFSYCDTDSCEKILLKSNSEISLLEITSLSSSVARKTVNYLSENDIMYLNDYVVLSYNTTSDAAIESLLSNVYIKNLYIPKPKTQKETAIYAEILDLKNKFDVQLNVYAEGEMLTFSDFTLFPIYYDEKERVAFTIYYRDKFYTYITANMLDKAAVNHALKIMNGADTVIIGSIGSASSSENFIYKLDEKTKLIYNKKTGLTDEILKYYENRITVDPNGSIELYVE